MLKETVSAGTGSAASVAVVYAAGQTGLSAVGISTGLVAIGGTMAGGLVVVGLIGIGGYKFCRWLLD